MELCIWHKLIFFFITLIVNVYILKETKLWISNILYLLIRETKARAWFGSLNTKYIGL